MRRIRLLFDDGPAEPTLDTALSHAVLRSVADGSSPETIRIHRPGRIVAFGRHDTVTPGYRDAVAASRRAGYEPIERLAGGRAAVFHEGTIAFAWAQPSNDPKTGVTSRFETISTLMRDAFRSLGVDAHVGEVPGEYCPGAYSVHASGAKKLMGVGQRLISGAAHTGGVVVAENEAETRAILVPVYEALHLAWDPATAGAVDSIVDAGWADVATAIIEAFSAEATLEKGEFSDAERDVARSLADQHLVGDQPSA